MSPKQIQAMTTAREDKRYALFLRASSFFVFILVSAMPFAAAYPQEVRVCPTPEGLELSNAFTVAVVGREVRVYKAKIPPAEPIPRLTGSRSEFGFASFASFDMRTSAAVTVTCPEPVQSVKILPTSFDIAPKVEGQRITVTLDEPKHVTVEVNGDRHESLHIFLPIPSRRVFLSLMTRTSCFSVRESMRSQV